MIDFEFRYNDGVYAGTMHFTENKKLSEIVSLFDEMIEHDFNNNPNPDYHITRDNVTMIVK